MILTIFIIIQIVRFCVTLNDVCIVILMRSNIYAGFFERIDLSRKREKLEILLEMICEVPKKNIGVFFLIGKI